MRNIRNHTWNKRKAQFSIVIGVRRGLGGVLGGGGGGGGGGWGGGGGVSCSLSSTPTYYFSQLFYSITEVLLCSFAVDLSFSDSSVNMYCFLVDIYMYVHIDTSSMA